MEKQTYIKTTSALFGIIGLLHLVRSVSGWALEIDGTAIPMWVSWLAVLVLGFLSIQGFRLSK